MTAGQSAWAQTAVSEGASTSQVSEVVVTGSHIPGAAETSILPIDVIPGANLSARGFTNVAQAVNELPIAGVGVTAIESEQTFGRSYVTCSASVPTAP
jgi:hypothetical protein